MSWVNGVRNTLKHFRLLLPPPHQNNSTPSSTTPFTVFAQPQSRLLSNVPRAKPPSTTSSTSSGPTIPPRPKKPLTPYFRYLGQVRDQVRKDNPNLKITEVMKKVAAQWDQLDEAGKGQYISAYKKDMESFSSILDKYRASLTPEQTALQEELKMEKHVKKEKRVNKQRIKEFVKPKTLSGFPVAKVGENIEVYERLRKELGVKWEGLSELEKGPLISKYQDEYYAGYEKELKKWEQDILPRQSINCNSSNNEGEGMKSHQQELMSLPEPYKTKNAIVGSVLGVDHAIQIVSTDDQHNFELNEEALAQVLLKEDIKDLPVAVVSVAGAFRKGKSFILDFFLRYLYARENSNSANWLGAENCPLEGFPWRGGAERDTSGILLWSKVFKVYLPTGERIAVLLMDTQGTFDSESTVKDCATIFALSTMTSSVQLYNLSQNIQEDDLQHLQLFTEYGRLALEDCSSHTPFQKLTFLVRDWSYPYEAPYGLDGGKKILERRLKISDKQHHELQSLRKHIKSCFQEIGCFLMPHPGLKVATNPSFDGRLNDIESDFRAQLSELVPLVLAPNHLVVKRIGGNKVKAKELLHYFKSYTAIYKGNELPEPKSMLEATAEANNLSAVAVAKDFYSNSMEEICGGSKSFMLTSRIEGEHGRVKEKAMGMFQSIKKMGGDNFSTKYRETLDKEIEELFVHFRAQNESKNIFKTARTPATLFTIAASCYVVSGVFGLFGMYFFADMFNLLMGITLLTLGTWAYVRHSGIKGISGEMRDVGSHIDTAASAVWEHGFKPLFAKTLSKGFSSKMKRN